MEQENFQIIKTGDGSYTLYLKEYDEQMHSRSGAYEEALLKQEGVSFFKIPTVKRLLN